MDVAAGDEQAGSGHPSVDGRRTQRMRVAAAAAAGQGQP